MTRRLSAILAIDVVGYSRMMGRDEAATVAALQRLRSEVFGPVFADHAGRIVKSMGDGWLVEFLSAVQAVNAAMQVQDRLRGDTGLRLRMGIHIGDVTRSEDDLYGDGINIAARLEALAPEGGIMISDAVYSGLDGTLAPSFEAAGEQHLKNIARPLRTWVRGSGDAALRVAAPAARTEDALPRLSIRPVRTSDTRDEVIELAHSLGADLRTFFNGINWLTADIRETAAEGSYVLDTVLRSRGDRLRLETRLTAPDGSSIWSHKSDSTLAESFDWQDEVAAEVASLATDLILEAETLRLAKLPDAELAPEHCLLMGMMAWRSFSNDSFIRSTEFHVRAFTANPTLADAYAEAIIVVCAARTLGASPQMQRYREQLLDWVSVARPLASGHAMLTLAIGTATYFEDLRPAPLNQCVEQVLRLAPFDPRILSFCGWARLWAGLTQEAHDCFLKSVQLGQLGPFLVASYGGLATCNVQLGRDEDAIRYADEGLKRADSYPTLYAAKAAALAMLDQPEAARDAMAKYRELMPERTLGDWKAANSYGGSTGGQRYFEALRRAGLPE